MTTSDTALRPSIFTRLLGDARFRFLLVGSLSAAIEFGAFVGLILFGAPPVASNVVSFALGLAASFIGYRAWSFAGTHTLSARRQFVAYFLLALFNVTATSVAIGTLAAHGVYPWAAKAICMMVVVTWNYLLLNRVIFKRSPDRPASLI